MIRTIKARFIDGGFMPLEKVEILEGEEVSLTFEFEPVKEEGEDLFLKAAGGWEKTIDTDELIRDIYADRQILSRSEVRL
ncbi:MAG: DUF104 domain-containing protein [Nitrospirae bacterium]|nr:DUF104 domain-containing protein [Nitrospirota bacterium]